MDRSSRPPNLRNGQKNSKSWKGKNWKENNHNMRKRKLGKGNSKPFDVEDFPKKTRLDSSCPRSQPVLRREAIDEIRDGLQLWVSFLAHQADQAEVSLHKLRGLHSFVKGDPEGSSISGVLLFTDVESLEAAKASLAKNSLISAVDYMGVRSNTAKITTDRKNPKLLLEFNYVADEETVRNLHEGITKIERLPRSDPATQSCFVVEFPSSSTIQQLQEAVGHNGLREVREYVPLTEQQKVLSKRHLKLIVLRDVPKSATVHDIATVFPNAIGIRLFRRTFPASNYCHAILLFPEVPAAFRALKKAQNAKVQGKRLFAFPFHHSMMRDMPDLGEKNQSRN